MAEGGTRSNSTVDAIKGLESCKKVANDVYEGDKVGELVKESRADGNSLRRDICRVSSKTESEVLYV